jgi:3D (Asp-Asp-Asp) domain-containing protein
MNTRWILSLAVPAVLACGPSGFQSEASTDSGARFSFLEPSDQGQQSFADNDFSESKTTPLPEESSDETSANPSPTSKREAPNNDLQAQGDLSPTIYFHALLRDEGSSCSSGRLVNLYGEKGVTLMRVCSNTLSVCAMEGSCQIARGDKIRSFNYEGQANGHFVFFEIQPGECVYGYGVQSSCLDPFFTVAADARFHKAGEVLYVPKVAGLVLPNGSKHSGYFVVRDQGGRIKGQHRFDFFSGNLKWDDPRNPFFKIELGDQNKKFAYSIVHGETAKKVLRERNYPNLPANESPAFFFSFEDAGFVFP